MAPSKQQHGLRSRVSGFFRRKTTPSGQGGVPNAHPRENIPHIVQIHPAQSANPSLGTHSQRHTPILVLKKEKLEIPPKLGHKPVAPVMTGDCGNHRITTAPHGQRGVPQTHPQKKITRAGQIHPRQSANPSLGTHSHKHAMDLRLKKENIEKPPKLECKPESTVTTSNCGKDQPSVPPRGQGGDPNAHPPENVSRTGQTLPGQSANPSLGTHSQNHTPDLELKKENIESPPEPVYKPLYPVLTDDGENHHTTVDLHDPAKTEMSVQQLLSELESKEKELMKEKENNEKQKEEMKNYMTDWFSERDHWYTETRRLEQIRSAEFMKFQVWIQGQSSEMQREQERTKLSTKMEMGKICQQLDSEHKEWNEEMNRMKGMFEMEREQMQLEFKKQLEDITSKFDQMFEERKKVKEEKKEKCQNLQTSPKQMDRCLKKLPHQNPKLKALRMEKRKMNAKVDKLERLVMELQKSVTVKEDQVDQQPQVFKITVEKQREDAENKIWVESVRNQIQYTLEYWNLDPKKWCCST